MARIKPPFKYYGGKFYLSKWIVENLPPHDVYVEPFGGAASVLLNKSRCNREIYNDLNPDLSNLMKFLRDDHKRLVDRLRTIPCEEAVYYEYKASQPTDPFEQAVRAFVLYRMSRGGTATTFSKSKRSYRGLPENVAAWETGINNLIHVHKRLQGVEIRCQDGLELIREMDGEGVAFYLDPPYVSTSRVNSSVYQLEMDEDSHRLLAAAICGCRGKVVLSGYDSELYRTLFAGWDCVSKDQFLHGGHSRRKQIRAELLWKNFHNDFTVPNGRGRISSTVA